MKNSFHFILICVSIFIGVVFAYLILPGIVRSIPNEQDRLKLIRESFNNPKIPQPEIVIVGPSYAMSLDGRKLSQLLLHQPIIWNLTTPGQLLIETFIILENAPANIKKVILTMPGSVLMRGANLTNKEKLVMYKMYDYTVSPKVLNSIKQLENSKKTFDFFTQPDWQSTLQSRWAIQNSINSLMTYWGRDDLDYKQLRENIFLPFPFKKNKELKTIQKTVRKRKQKKYITESFRPLEDSMKLMDDIRNSLKEKNIELMLVIVPEHPFEVEARGKAYYLELEKWIAKMRAEKQYKIFNYNRLVTSPDYFVDRMHTNLAGAEIIINQLARDLNNHQ